MKTANGHICTTGDPIHFMFIHRLYFRTSCLWLGFSGSADRMALFPVTSNPSWRQAAILDNFKWPYSQRSNYITRIARSSLR